VELDKNLEEIKNVAFKVINLSDGRFGIIVTEKKKAKEFHKFLKENKLKPTKIHHTIYGYSFKFNDVSTLKTNWPYSMMPPEYDSEIHGPIYKKWDNFKYHGYNEREGKVHLTEYTPIGGGGSRIKSIKVPYPASLDDWKGRATKVMTSIRPKGVNLSGDIPYYTFTSYVWSFMPENGNWLCKLNEGLTPIANDEMGEFITKSLQLGKATYGK
jgi:hypothetical protein